MTSLKLFRGIAAVAGCAALAAPAAALGQGGDGPHAAPHQRPQAQWVTNVLQGEIASVKRGERTSSLVVSVKKTNSVARRFRGKDINVDIATGKYGTRVETKDHNGDGKRNAADLAAGDLVVIQSRVPKNFRPPLNGFRMLPQLIIAKRPGAEQTSDTETNE